MPPPAARRSRRRLPVTVLTAVLAAVTLGAPSPASASDTAGEYLIGRGISDVTGEAAETGMMGYSSFDQKTSGIHQRQRSRAFVVVDRASGKRVVYVNADLAMIFQSVRQGVLARLKERYGSLYGEENVLLSATHTHSGPGGYSHNVAYNLSVLGFQKKTYRAIVDGITDSVVEAHQDLKPGTMSLGTGTLTNASVNRSRAAFDRNPAADRAAFPDAIDPAMTVLRFRQGGEDVGAINWFATHNTSITNKNTLISPDNKGYASYAWEHGHEGVRYLDDTPGFVAAFPNTNAGDMSPNLNLKPGSGPTEDEFENARIIGERQLDKAREIHRDAEPVAGGVDSRLAYVDMEDVTVGGAYTPDGEEHRTCPAVVGASTLAGSVEDGPAIPLFEEGMRTPIAPILEALRVDTPSWLAACQYPKASLIPTGLLSDVHPVTPKRLPLQIMKIGELHLVAAPGEFTIASGLRVRRTVAERLGVPLDRVLLQGYANAYSQYVTTPEEYDTQNYEGGSTLYGRYTLPAYQQEYARIADSLRAGTALDRGTAPPDESGRQFTFQTGVVYDNPPSGKSFGSVLKAPEGSYARGSTATAEFATGHPKNDVRRGSTFLEVQRLENGTWKRVLDDGDWETTYRWTRLNGLTGTSKATITWRIAPDTAPGAYRIVHHGDAKSLLGKITPFTGATGTFTVR
ncbi:MULTISPECIES: neutral/alkaline ceramidase [Streptomyces]|uniref:neutral/alkaline ceramidase n=1 Tax=Streptomyces TaxID=1883 RepID=UPI0004C19481|nr:neutral/alkaline ceramidase [Streptomyces californicus]NEA11586.1 neutral/alkaline ceramidase [Streptomyces sp. SID10692]QRV58440.1 neutral/alkaline ceramidase [Streptomyces californicus]